MKDKPFFSIVIPTCNRANLLHNAIKSYLFQDFTDFEIVIFDNNSQDNTKEIVNSFNDRRIKYFNNKINIGFIKNCQRAILKAKGKYIITHGDDDVILFHNSLSVLRSIILIKKVGFIRINVLSKDRSNKQIRHVWVNKKNNIYIKPNSTSLNIINFFEITNSVFISGLVFKNQDIEKKEFINSEIFSWINIIFRLTKKYGAYFLFNSFIVANWSGFNANNFNNLFDIEDLYFNTYYKNIVNNLLSNKEEIKFKLFYSNKIIQQSIFALPSLKYYTNNSNLIRFKEALNKFDNKITSNTFFLFFFYLSILLPKWLIGFIRNNIHYVRKDTDLMIEDIATPIEIKRINRIYQQIISN